MAGCSDDEYVAPRPQGRAEVVDPAAAASTLDRLSRALGAGDVDAARALGSGAGADLLAAAAATVAAARLGDITLRYVTETGRTTGTDGWEGVVALTWRVEGIDTSSARVEVPVGFADAGTRIATVGGTTGRLPLWLTGPVAVRRVPGGLVMAAATPSGAPRADLDDLERWTRRAVDRARAVVGGTAGLVVEVPADGQGLVRALGASPGAYDSIAAVTAPVDGSRAPGTPVHVFINPPVFDGLDDLAAQVVMTHEGVHALTDAPLSASAPLWLVEGFADYVALRDVRLPVSRTAGQVIAQVKQGGAPAALPADTDFGTATTHLGAIYEAAWQVTVVLAERSGESALVGFYDAVLAGAKVAPELQSRFGWSEADLTAAWRGRLDTIAGVAG